MEQPSNNQNINGGIVGVAVVGNVYDGVTVHMPPSLPPTAPRQLRAPTSDFVGRAKEITDLVTALGKASATGGVAAINSIRGMGGIGKSELAYMVAARMHDQFDYQIELDLRGSQLDAAISSVQALQTVINAFGRLEKLPDDERELTALYRSLLHGKRVLIFADDAKDAAQVRPLMPPLGSALLVTSRFLFELDGMKTVDLDKLPIGKAVKLVQTINAAIPKSTAFEIAELCGRLPLALLVVASLTKKKTRELEEYVRLLRDEYTRLSGMIDTRANRNVEASLSLSYKLLTPVQQQVLAQLGVFRGSFDWRAVKVIVMLNKADQLVDILDLLHESSLLEWDTDQARYSLHELVRVFALARLREREEEEASRLHHAGYYIAVADTAEQQFKSGGDNITSALALFDRERTQLDAARTWLHNHAVSRETDDLLIADAQATVSIGDLRYLKRSERVPQLETALKAARRCANLEVQGRLLGNLGNANVDLGEVQRAIGLYGQLLVIAREIGDRQGEGIALGNLGLAYYRLGEVQRAIDSHNQALVISREIGDRHAEGQDLNNLGLAYMGLGKVQQAIGLYEQRLVIAREIGDHQREGIAFGNLSRALTMSDDIDAAIRYGQQSLDLHRGMGNQLFEGVALQYLGYAWTLRDPAQAENLHREALIIIRGIGARAVEGRVLADLTAALLAQQRFADAVVTGEEAARIAEECGDRATVAEVQWQRGLALEQQGHLVAAAEALQIRTAYRQELGHLQAHADTDYLVTLRKRMDAEQRTQFTK